MNNPWENIALDDYENHMKVDSVGQFQVLNEIIQEQFCAHTVSTMMVLGIAGGNGLDYITPNQDITLYGVDINDGYLKECVRRFPHLQNRFVPILADLRTDAKILPKADLMIANLFIEYIGYEKFQQVAEQVCPQYISCAIQVDTDDSFISDTPYAHVFEPLEEVHHLITEEELVSSMEAVGYGVMSKKAHELPNGKKLLRLDFQVNV